MLCLPPKVQFSSFLRIAFVSAAATRAGAVFALAWVGPVSPNWLASPGIHSWVWATVRGWFAPQKMRASRSECDPHHNYHKMNSSTVHTLPGYAVTRGLLSEELCIRQGRSRFDDGKISNVQRSNVQSRLETCSQEERLAPAPNRQSAIGNRQSAIGIKWLISAAF